MSSSNNISFGLKNGISVEVSEVVSGLACGCICPACNGKLQANKSKSKYRVSYFSHDPSENTQSCSNAFETSVHFMAKQILSEEAYICYPGIYIKRTRFDLSGELHLKQKLGFTGSKFSFTKVKLEKKLTSIRPDIIAYREDKQLLIEVAVTHFVDLKKKNIIRELGLPCIEIDLSSISYSITKKELKTLIVDKTNNKKWLSAPNLISTITDVEASLDEIVYEANERKRRERETLANNFNKRKKIESEKNGTTKDLRSNSSNTLKLENKTQVLQSECNELRWFVCESCLTELGKSSNAVFTLKLKDAPDSAKIVVCPKCGGNVSTISSEVR